MHVDPTNAIDQKLAERISFRVDSQAIDFTKKFRYVDEPVVRVDYRQALTALVSRILEEFVALELERIAKTQGGSRDAAPGTGLVL